MGERVGVYPGTFDPITNGHIDIIGRAALLFDRLVVGVAVNEAKGPILSLDDRMDLARIETAPITANTGTPIEVRPLRTLLVDFARSCGAGAVVRGLRVVSDFDYEFQMAGMNHRLAPEIETLFLMASEHHQFISSSLVRQIARFGGDIASFVPTATLACVLDRLRG
jgi:pantetheine-phosphate adenylyltransferase